MKNIRERILGLMKSENYQPMNKSEFSRALNLPSSERSEMRAALNKLERKGVIVAGKKSRYSLAGSGVKSDAKTGGKTTGGGIMVGVIRFQNGGNAWFYPDI